MNFLKSLNLLVPLCVRPNNKFNNIPQKPKKKQKTLATTEEVVKMLRCIGKVMFISRCERCTSLVADEFC